MMPLIVVREWVLRGASPCVSTAQLGGSSQSYVTVPQDTNSKVAMYMPSEMGCILQYPYHGLIQNPPMMRTDLHG